MYIIGINGSPRENGNTAEILRSMLEGVASPHVETEYFHLPSYHIEGCIGCERCRRDKTCTQFKDDMHLLYDRIDRADGLILGSPTYNYGMTPWMKAFIDRLYPFFDFTEPRPGPYRSRLADRGKRALVFAVCEQIDEKEVGYTIVNMRDAIAALGYSIHDTLAFSNHFLPNSVRKDATSRKRAYTAGRDFMHVFSSASQGDEGV
ncbi:MAG TPA: flavodoxin family protein [Sphaerochaetaceae bacterium]|nr:flavodoxin family protein [Sphaerochaetaceae bacterium]